jgi:hypothetical protein
MGDGGVNGFELMINKIRAQEDRVVDPHARCNQQLMRKHHVDLAHFVF